MNRKNYTIKDFNKNFSVEQALETFIPGKYKYIKTCSNGQKRYLYSGAKDNCPNAIVTKSGKFVCYHMSDVIGYRNSMTSFDIVKKYICNGDSKQTYNYLVNQGYIQNTSHQPTSLRGGSRYEMKPIKYSEMDITKIEPLTWLVEGIIPRNTLSLIFGAGGSGKSTVIQNMVKCMAEGIDFCGRATNLGDKEKILFLQATTEDSIEAVCVKLHNMGLDPKNNQIMLDKITGAPIDVFAEELSNTVKTENIKLVIIDSAISLLNGKDDNSATMVDNILLNLANIVNEHKCSIVLIHHSRKKGRDGILSNTVDDLLGSQRWSAGVRFVTRISTDKKSRKTTLSVQKENIFALLSNEGENNYNGDLVVVADKNMNYSFDKFTPVNDIEKTEKVSKNEESYNKIIDYISSTTLESLKEKYSQTEKKGQWYFLCKELNIEYEPTFCTAAKKYMENNHKDIAEIISQIKA